MDWRFVAPGYTCYCESCDVFGVGAACWLCGTADRWRPGHPTFAYGGAQIHSHQRDRISCAGRELLIGDPADTPFDRDL